MIRRSDSAMKLAILRKKYTYHGGAEGFSHSLIKRLAGSGNEVHIYAIQWSSPDEDNIYFHKVPAITCNSFLRDLTFSLSSFFLLKRQRKHCDIIQSHDRTLYQDIYRAGDGCHREWLRQRWGRSNAMKKLSLLMNPYHWLILTLEKMIFKGQRFKKIIAISKLVKNNIIEHYGVSEADIKVIYNGVDLERFHPENRKRYREEIRARYAIDKDAFVVLFVGSGFERKGLEFLLKAVECISGPVTVLVVGRGSPEKFQSFIKGNTVVFCGTRRDIDKYYAAADVFLFPTMYEPFGNVHLEAMASGLPVVTTKQSGASEIIADGKQGFVVEKPEDVREMAEKVTRLMKKDLRLKMGEEARKCAELFSFDRHIQETLQLYDTVLQPGTESGQEIP
jgi:UDP-glucose:(heptosyl)LPS alpha-1,3-glucosyltransferase